MFKKAAFGLVLGLGITLAVSNPGRLAQAQEKTSPDCAINWLPSSTSSFSIHLRNKEQIDVILKSKALKKLKEMPFAKILKDKFMEGFNDGWNKQKEGDPSFDLKMDIAKKALDVVIQLGSDELTIATGPNMPESFRYLQKLLNSVQMAPLASLLGGDLAALENPNGVQLAALIKAISESPEKLKIPDMLLAFRLKDTKLVEGALPKVEEQLPLLGLLNPKMAGAAKKEKIAGGEFITLRVNGSMFPLDDLDIPNLDEKQEKIAKDALKKLSLVVAGGLRGHYLVFYVGPDDKFLASIGKGDSIASSKDLTDLKNHSNSKITLLQYANKQVTGVLRNNPEDVKESFNYIKDLVKKADLPKDLGQKVNKDVNGFLDDALAFIPKPGHELTVGSMTNKGWDFVNYNYSESLTIDGSQPLSILKNLGGTPILAFAGRGSFTEGEKQFKFMVKWLGIGYGYAKEFGLPNLPPDQRDVIDPLLKQFEPLFKEIGKTTVENLLPALKDSQLAFVLDGKLASKKWGPDMPKSKVDLPILEPALVLGVSDADKLRKAMESYRETLDRLIQAMAGLDPTGQLAQIRITAPEKSGAGKNQFYFYPIPQLKEIDARLKPNAGLNSNALAVTLSLEHSERLLKDTPLAAGAFKGIDLDKNLGCVFLFNEEAFLKFLRPWAEYALAQLPPEIEAQFNVSSQVKEMFQLLGVCKGMAGYSYKDGNAWVTRVLSLWQDLD